MRPVGCCWTGRCHTLPSVTGPQFHSHRIAPASATVSLTSRHRPERSLTTPPSAPACHFWAAEPSQISSTSGVPLSPVPPPSGVMHRESNTRSVPSEATFHCWEAAAEQLSSTSCVPGAWLSPSLSAHRPPIPVRWPCGPAGVVGRVNFCPAVVVPHAAVARAVPGAVEEPLTSAHRPEAWLTRVPSAVPFHCWTVEPSQSARTRAVPEAPDRPAGITHLPCTHSDPSRPAIHTCEASPAHVPVCTAVPSASPGAWSTQVPPTAPSGPTGPAGAGEDGKSRPICVLNRCLGSSAAVPLIFSNGSELTGADCRWIR